MGRSKLIIVGAILLVVLSVRFLFVFTAPSVYGPGDKVSFNATLYEEPVTSGNMQRFSADVIRVFAPRFPSYHYGDRLVISGTISQGDSSNKASALGKKEHDLVMYFPKIEREKSTPHALAVISGIRQQVVRSIEQALPASPAALLSGIVFGARERFSSEFIDGLRNTGTLHVVAASGMNVTIVAAFITTVLLRFLPRRVVAAVVIIGLIFYAGLASFQAPIVRATIMGGIAFGASTLNRQAFASWSLIMAVFLMLLVDPRLLFDVGFQLSFAATAGLLLLKPAIENTWVWFQTISRVVIVGDSFTTTLVAQAATLPILLANFGTISIVSILVNTLILWVVQPIMVLGIVAAILSIVPFLGTIPIIATLPLLAFFESVVMLFNRPEFLIELEIPFLVGVGYYCLLIGAYFALKKGR